MSPEVANSAKHKQCFRDFQVRPAIPLKSLAPMQVPQPGNGRVPIDPPLGCSLLSKNRTNKKTLNKSNTFKHAKTFAATLSGNSTWGAGKSPMTIGTSEHHLHMIHFRTRHV